MNEKQLKAFVARNKVPIAQMLIAAALVIAGVIMLDMSARSYPVPAYKPLNESAGNLQITQNISIAGQGKGAEINCTPLFNSSRKISYSYRVSSKSPEGSITSDISYSYEGEDYVAGQRVDVVVLKANGTVQNMTISPVAKMWLDYSTGKCIKGELTLGPNYVYPVSCEDSGFGMPVVTCKEQLEALSKMGSQEIYVPAGKFNASRYDNNTESIWIADGVPVPVKFTFEEVGETAVAELMSFSVKP